MMPLTPLSQVRAERMLGDAKTALMTHHLFASTVYAMVVVKRCSTNFRKRVGAK
jgi:hypothetical protein